MKTAWTTIARPGYLGGQREAMFTKWTEEHGKGNWRLAWIWQESSVDFIGACAIYEESYYNFLQQNIAILGQLVTQTSDIYDDNPSNVASGTDYSIQETRHTHIQDIAIRRCLKRLNTTFQGNELIQIRHNLGTHELSMTLSPGIVPFHNPSRIVKPWLTGWWNEGSVECFYQSNRVLQVLK